MSRISGNNSKGLRVKRKNLVDELAVLEKRIEDLRRVKHVRECEIMKIDEKLGMLGGD